MTQMISLKEYYPWSKCSEARFPWERQYLNYDFLKFEKKKINDLSNWYNKFQKTERNKYLDAASFYVKPVSLNSSWKAAIAECGDFNYVGLSALCSSPPLLLIGLIPRIRKQPLYHRLINITKSKKMYLFNRLFNKAESVLFIEDWDELESDRIYVDVAYESKIISKILDEKLFGDEQISLCFQSPIISAPFDGSIGGISLSSLSGSSSFSKELTKTIQLMVPPEYRTLQPPKIIFDGKYFQYRNGIEFRLSERPYSDNNVLSSFFTTQYNIINSELRMRSKFSGEFSIASSISPNKADMNLMLQELWKNFSDTEITLSKEIDKLPESDTDLTRLQKVIDEDIWLQVVNSRQYSPIMSKDAEKDFTENIDNRLWEDFDALLPDTYKNESREFLIRKLLSQSKCNLMRIAQSFARSEIKEQLERTQLKDARNLILDNFTDLVMRSDVRKIESKVGKRVTNPRYLVVQTELISNPGLTTQELFNAVKSTNLFRDLYDLQGFLDWLDENGFVSLDPKKRYRWVERIK